MSEKVGPGFPPPSGRFRKGQSGNPKGRPRARREEPQSAFDIIVEKVLTVRQGGEKRQLTVKEALQHQTYRDAIAGSRAARREVLKWIGKREKARAARAKPTLPHVELKTSEDPENADEALLLLGIATHDQPRGFDGSARRHLLLEPWAVQMALSRRRGGHRLTSKEMSEIERCTRQPETLRWQRGSGE
jgi:hypothetical protein